MADVRAQVQQSESPTQVARIIACGCLGIFLFVIFFIKKKSEGVAMHTSAVSQVTHSPIFVAIFTVK